MLHTLYILLYKHMDAYDITTLQYNSSHLVMIDVGQYPLRSLNDNTNYTPQCIQLDLSLRIL